MRPNRARILFVDDHRDTCDAVAALLSRRGYEIIVADSLVTGLLAARGQAFDLYVVGGQLRGSYGAGLCRSIREFDPVAPIIFFSSRAEDGARREAIEAGATVYVIKPDVRGLVEAVNRVASPCPADDGPDAAPPRLVLRQEVRRRRPRGLLSHVPADELVPLPPVPPLGRLNEL